MKRSVFISMFAVICTCISAQDFRTINGVGNNVQNPNWGSSNALLNRQAPADYIDGIGIPKLDESFGRPNPRFVSNQLFDQPIGINSDKNLSDYVWAFGQFIEHDLSLTLDDKSQQLNNIVAPEDDQFFVPGALIAMSRSKIALGSGTSLSNPINYQNEVTSYLDGSMVYGSDTNTAAWLRSFKSGKLKVSTGDLLPWNTEDGEHNNSAIDPGAPKMDDPLANLTKYFIAGDQRANENPILTSIHTVFVREHNRICDELQENHPNWNDELLYQTARRWNVALIQRIVFEEWLPAMGVHLPLYREYNNSLKVDISNEFSIAAFRFGYTLINSDLIRMESDGRLSTRGSISLKDAYFNPYSIVLSNGIDPFLKGMATQPQQNLDCKVINDVRNFSISSDRKSGIDLAAININRGRERGLQPYNNSREAFGLAPVPSFLELTKDQGSADILTHIYGNINNLDLWVGLLAENHMSDAMMGRLMLVIMKSQFQKLRDGDRFYFENDLGFTEAELAEIKNTTLRDVIMRNTSITLMQENVFEATKHEDIANGPPLIPVTLDIQLFPTVVTDRLNVKLFLEKPELVEFQILDLHGANVLTSSISMHSGESQVGFNIPESFQSAPYLIMVSTKDRFSIKQFLKH